MIEHWIEGDLNASGLRIGVVASRFHDDIVSALLDGALRCAGRHGAVDGEVAVYRVPGAFEVPQLLSRLTRQGGFDALVALGVLIRGDTPHFDFISAQVTREISRVAVDAGLPIGFGVITCNTRDQALERAGDKAGNKGWEAMLAAIEMARLYRRLDADSADRGPGAGSARGE